MTKLIQILWRIFLFIFPFSLHLVVYEKASYRFGHFNPWVTGFLFLPELLLFFIFALWLIQKIYSNTLRKLKRPHLLLVLFFLFLLNAGLVTFFQGDLNLFYFFAIHVLGAGIIYLLIKNEITPYDVTITWLLYGALFQIIVTYLQTRFNGSVGLAFLGEPHIGPEVLNVAKTDLTDGTKMVRGYGTFLHSNILAAYLMTILFISLPYLKRAALPFWVILLTAGIYLSGSQAAELTTLLTFGLLIGLSLLKHVPQKKWFSLGVLGILLLGNLWFFVNSSQVTVNLPSLAQRLEQNVVSLNMFLNNFWGTGIGSFTLEMENYAPQTLMPWEFQPVHNIYFLTLNEMGIQGFILLALMLAYLLHTYFREDFFYNIQEKARILSLFALIIIASFDHLLLTSVIGLWLIAFVLAETTRTT